MQIKVNHFASKDLKLSVMFGWEAIVTEYFISFLCAFFAYIGYNGGLALLFYLCLPASVGCFLSAVYTTYEHFRFKNIHKPKKSALATNGNTEA
jgi:hypothetical protein